MTDRSDKAREGILKTVQMYAPVHAAFSEEALRRLNQAIDEYHNSVVEAALSLRGLPLTSPPVVDPKATSIVPLMNPPAEVSKPTVPDDIPLPSAADQAAGKPVVKGKGKAKS